jgi:hypothetical protein
LSGYQSFDLIYDATTVHRNSTQQHVTNWPAKFQDALDKHRAHPNAVQLYSDRNNAFAVSGLPVYATTTGTNSTTSTTSVDDCPDVVLLRGN